ncbi:9569_t:CDS:2 [Entrophospora sp. SA101]|nr:9569_t:CDS:2 [Entrophospora sp. SA101]
MWKKYLEKNPKLLETFQKFWKHRQNQTITIDVNFVAGEMQTLYKWMSERIHSINARGDVVEWSKSDLGNEWSQMVEYMFDLEDLYRRENAIVLKSISPLSNMEF